MSLLCPVCGSKAKVVDSRPPRRRYHCRCGYKYSTLETLDGELPESDVVKVPKPGKLPKPANIRRTTFVTGPIPKTKADLPTNTPDLIARRKLEDMRMLRELGADDKEYWE